MSAKKPRSTFHPVGAFGALVVAAFLLAAASSALAQAAGEKPADKPKRWESVAAAGLTLTSGNSESFMATIGFNTARKWTHDEVYLGASAGYGETTDRDTGDHSTTDQYVKGFGQYNHLFSERFYAGIKADGIYDNVAGIDYRFIVSPLAGYYFIKTPKTFLAGELGPSFVAENLRGESSDQYIGLRVGERFEHRFSDRAKIWQTAEWMPDVEDFEKWLLTAEVGVSAALTRSIDVRLVLQDQYNSRPARDRNGNELKENDLKVIAGIAYKF